ncbi:uncharacterized protein LOC133277970 [Pezoporus flaviventris]|uniref:uncharacterized protein LOC133277970 n=1 Tax=Pezoporus flaviventris TaxID=889875 RepID=UPI002AB0614A|nr:uncharacterized protein LOC133277970 [Pezoporus flaviventris]
MFFPPQCPFCQQPSWPPVLCRSALPKEHGGRPGLAALPARLPSSLLWEGPAQLRPSRILPWGSLRFGAFVALLPLSPSTCPASLAQVWSLLGHDHSSSHHDISKDCLLGQLLGRLIVCWTSKIWAIQQEALVALHHLSIFIQHQKCMTSPQPDNCHDHPEHPQAGGKREAGKPSCLSLCSTISMAKVMSFFLAGPLVWGIRTRLVQAKGSRTSGLGMTSLSLVRGLLLFWSRDFRGLHSRVPPLSPRDLSSYPLLRNDCSPCCQLSRGSSRQSCSHCPAEQHYQGTQCNTSSPPSSFLQAFEEYLHPADKTVIILRAIQAMRDSCVCDKEELISVLNVAMTEPASWLTEVSSLWLPCPPVLPGTVPPYIPSPLTQVLQAP